jgi:hypothetical protein
MKIYFNLDCLHKFTPNGPECGGGGGIFLFRSTIKFSKNLHQIQQIERGGGVMPPATHPHSSGRPWPI